MRDVTLCMAYYLNPGMLAVQYEHLAAMPADLKAHLSLIVVDDGSPSDPASPPASDLGFPLAIFRMREDIRWNQDACRNLAVAQAATDWVLLTDIDHMLPEATLRQVVTGKLDGRRAYRFSRISAPDMAPYKPHPNSWLMTRAVYGRAGGYDEGLAGFYGTDGDFRDRVREAAEIELLKEPLIRVPREVIADASTTTYERKTEADGAGLRAAKQARGPGWTPLHDRFAWDRVA